MRAVYSIHLTALLLLALFQGGPVAAQQVYKCTHADGKVAYAGEPCVAARSSERILIQHNTLDASALRDYAVRQENEQLKAQLKNQQDAMLLASLATPSQARTPTDEGAVRASVRDCDKAKRDYEVTASSTANSEAIVEAKRSIMFGTCGLREPDKRSTTISNVTYR